MRTNIFLFVFLVFNLISQAQENKIKEIKERYNQIEESREDFNTHSIELNYMLPATGPKTKVVSFQYFPTQSDPENDPYKMDYSLQKVTVSYNAGQTGGYYYEYLYSETGNLIFYYERYESGVVNYEKRFYFNNDKLIKYIYTNPDPVPGEDTDKPKYKKFTKRELSEAKAGIVNAEKYQLYFTQIETLDEID